MPDLGPVVAHIRRADEHATRLGGEVTTYINRPPYHRSERMLENGHIVDRVEMIHQPPIELAMSFSDGIHQLRAALDNLEFQAGLLVPVRRICDQGEPRRCESHRQDGGCRGRVSARGDSPRCFEWWRNDRPVPGMAPR